MPLTQTRRLLMAAIVIVSFATCAGYVIYGRVWSAQAETAVRETVLSQGTGQSVKGIVASVDRAAIPTDFLLPYEIIGPANISGRAPLTGLLSPRDYYAILKFRNGRKYEVDAIREHGVWQVIITLRP
jgi:hypothetical protein